MNKLIFFLIAVLLLDSCKKDDKLGDVKIDFSASWNGTALEFGQGYSYFNGANIQFQNVRFFLSDIKLIKDGVDIKLSDVAIFDLDENFNSLSISDIEVGEYDGIKFGIGVYPELNATTPADYTSTEILGNSSDYWEVWESYIHTKTEGRLDTDGDGVFETNFLYHTGLDVLYRTQEFTKKINVMEDQSMELKFDLDLYKVFFDGTSYFDISANPISHTNPSVPGSVDISTIISNGYSRALSIE